MDLWINEKRLGTKSINQIFNFVLLFVMRKSIGLLALLVCAMILSACGREGLHEKQTSLTYSNLVDTGSRAQLAQLLADAGISEQSISGLMSNIIHFNQIA